MRSVFTVCMPYLAKSDREQGSITPAYVQSVAYLTAVGWPFLAFFGTAAYSAIRIVYGPQWDDAVPIAQVLCIAFAFELVHCLSREALVSSGRAREANRLQIVLAVLLAAGLLAGVPFGLVGAAWGVAAHSALGMLVSQWFLSRHIGLHAADLVRSCLPSVALTAMSAAPVALWAAFQGVGEHNFVLFGVGGGLLTALCWLVAIHVLRHPLAEELEPAMRHLRALWSSAGGGGSGAGRGRD